MKKKTVVVIFGGSNTEYYASCDSVGGMLDYIDRNLFDVLLLGVTIEGDWILTEATSKEVQDGVSWLKREGNKRAIISPIKDRYAIFAFENNTFEEIEIDCVFPLISGYGGEDGTLQGLLELANIPYVGAKVAASANGMDKALTRLFAASCNLKQPECVVLKKQEYIKDKENIKNLITFGYPVFAKPASLGSSVGISKIDCEDELAKGLEKAFQYEDKVLIEKGIMGSEIKVAVLGNEQLEMGELCELKTRDGENDYAAKHITFTSTKQIPADITKEVEEKAKYQAAAIYKALDCKGFARVDFFLTEDNELYFNEINTVPGIGKHSVYSRMFEASGISLTEVLTRLINLAFEDVKQVAETTQDSFADFLSIR